MGVIVSILQSGIQGSRFSSDNESVLKLANFRFLKGRCMCLRSWATIIPITGTDALWERYIMRTVDPKSSGDT